MSSWLSPFDRVFDRVLLVWKSLLWYIWVQVAMFGTKEMLLLFSLRIRVC